MHCLGGALDGFAAGSTRALPIRSAAAGLRDWWFGTRLFKARSGAESGAAEEPTIGDRFVEQADAGIGATIMGRNMLGPVRDEMGRRVVDGLVGR